MHSTVVVFPAPFAPARPTISPARTSRSRRSTTTLDPYALRSPRTVTPSNPVMPEFCRRAASQRISPWLERPHLPAGIPGCAGAEGSAAGGITARGLTTSRARRLAGTAGCRSAALARPIGRALYPWIASKIANAPKPSMASRSGRQDHDHELDGYTPVGHQRRCGEHSDHLDRFRAVSCLLSSEHTSSSSDTAMRRARQGARLNAYQPAGIAFAVQAGNMIPTTGPSSVDRTGD